jgi:hypothetical protein
MDLFNNTTKQIRCLVFCALCFSYLLTSAQKTKKPVYRVSGKVVQTSEYCGGARPTEEMEAEFALQKPYPGKVLYVKKGNKNSLKKPVLFKFISNEAGEFSFDLPAGEYVILQEEQLDCLDIKKFKTNEYTTVDEACLKTWWKTPLKMLVIKKSAVNDLLFAFHHPCFVQGDVPCLRYNGPTPP